MMTTEDLIEALQQRYGNPYAAKEMALIQEATKRLQELNYMINNPTEKQDAKG